MASVDSEFVANEPLSRGYRRVVRVFYYGSGKGHVEAYIRGPRGGQHGLDYFGDPEAVRHQAGILRDRARALDEAAARLDAHRRESEARS